MGEVGAGWRVVILKYSIETCVQLFTETGDPTFYCRTRDEEGSHDSHSRRLGQDYIDMGESHENLWPRIGVEIGILISHFRDSRKCGMYRRELLGECDMIDHCSVRNK